MMIKRVISCALAIIVLLGSSNSIYSMKAKAPKGKAPKNSQTTKRIKKKRASKKTLVLRRRLFNEIKTNYPMQENSSYAIAFTTYLKMIKQRHITKSTLPTQYQKELQKKSSPKDLIMIYKLIEKMLEFKEKFFNELCVQSLLRMVPPDSTPVCCIIS